MVACPSNVLRNSVLRAHVPEMQSLAAPTEVSRLAKASFFVSVDNTAVCAASACLPRPVCYAFLARVSRQRDTLRRAGMMPISFSERPVAVRSLLAAASLLCAATASFFATLWLLRAPSPIERDTNEFASAVERADRCNFGQQSRTTCAEYADQVAAHAELLSASNLAFGQKGGPHDVYVIGARIVFVRKNCGAADIAVDEFAAAEYPADVTELPPDRRSAGYTFTLQRFSTTGIIGSACVLIIPTKLRRIGKLQVGQFNSQKQVWAWDRTIARRT